VMMTCREPMPKAYLDRACGARGGGGGGKTGAAGQEADARQQVQVKMGSGCGATVTAWAVAGKCAGGDIGSTAAGRRLGAMQGILQSRYHFYLKPPLLWHYLTLNCHNCWLPVTPAYLPTNPLTKQNMCWSVQA
jgi:hypothetical protein